MFICYTIKEWAAGTPNVDQDMEGEMWWDVLVKLLCGDSKLEHMMLIMHSYSLHAMSCIGRLELVWPSELLITFKVSIFLPKGKDYYFNLSELSSTLKRLMSSFFFQDSCHLLNKRENFFSPTSREKTEFFPKLWYGLSDYKDGWKINKYLSFMCHWW